MVHGSNRRRVAGVALTVGSRPGYGACMSLDARAVRNRRAAGPSEPYGLQRSTVLDARSFDAARVEVTSWSGYAVTPLVSLAGLAAKLGIAELRYKDEGGRFGLDSFKALGGAYAVARVLQRRLVVEFGGEAMAVQRLRGEQFAALIRNVTVTCATDGNHGRSVAWGAQHFGCRCVIFVHRHVSQARREAIARLGAEVQEVPGGYDEAVRHAAAVAADRGWVVVSDTSYPGYREVPRDVMHGYGVMADEIIVQWPAGGAPTHVFVQAGVGALAAALCARFWMLWAERRPRFVVVEPLGADCVFRSLKAGRRVVVRGAHETVMAGLACGEVSELAWEILHAGADAAIACADGYALAAMRVLAAPLGGDVPIVAGETGGSGVAALLAADDHPELAARLGLDRSSRVLVIGSEGATDAEIYRDVVGCAPDDVRAHG